MRSRALLQPAHSRPLVTISAFLCVLALPVGDPPDVSVVVVFFDHTDGKYPADTPVVSPTGPAVPPTLARALNLHLKAPHAALTSNLPRGGITPIKIAPIQEAQSTDNHDTTPIRANL